MSGPMIGCPHEALGREKWALLLFGAGINPQPPPQQQVEEADRETKIKKESESGDP